MTYAVMCDPLNSTVRIFVLNLRCRIESTVLKEKPEYDIFILPSQTLTMYNMRS